MGASSLQAEAGDGQEHRLALPNDALRGDLLETHECGVWPLGIFSVSGICHGHQLGTVAHGILPLVDGKRGQGCRKEHGPHDREG